MARYKQASKKVELIYVRIHGMHVLYTLQEGRSRTLQPLLKMDDVTVGFWQSAIYAGIDWTSDSNPRIVVQGKKRK